MKQYFIFADVHNCYSALMQGLEDSGFNIDDPNHVIISAGDAFDRGPEADKVLDFFMNVIPQNRRIFIRGNHDDLFNEIVGNGGLMNAVDKSNGLDKTWNQLNDKELIPLWKKYYKEAVNFVRIEDYVITHGWIPNIDRICDLDLPFPMRIWEEARWGYSPEKIREAKYKDITFIVGHIHASHFHNSHETFHMLPTDKYSGIIALDGCTNLTGMVNVWNIVSEEKPIIG